MIHQKKGKNWRSRFDDDSESYHTVISGKDRQNIEVVAMCHGVVDMVFRVVVGNVAQR